MVMRSKMKSQNTFPPPLRSSRAQLPSRISPPSPPSGTGGQGWGLWSSHVIFCRFTSSGRGLITLFPCSSVVSHPRETVLHELLQRGPFPRAAVLHELLQHGSIPRCAVLQEHTAPARVPHGVTSPARKPALWAPLSTDPQVLPGACSSAGFPRGHSLLREPTCSGVGSSTGYRWISAPPWTSLDCRGTACLTRVFTTGCRGIFAPAPGASPPPPSSLTLVSAGLFLLHVLTPHSGGSFSLSQLFFLLKNVITEALPLSLIGSALAGGGSVLEPASMGSLSLEHRGSFQQLLTEATPVTPPPRYQNLAKQNQYSYLWLCGPMTPQAIREEMQHIDGLEIEGWT
ncbi:uncharacterized protein LOC126035336 [Accipiter gentilis]|uniref:uncharacterized protein LOC126035336 n=1 Tax=Astur gentilis TaxID=8957 RepID=UPI0021104DDF|nr:uncharacterized protein LOC126035336 [Accipiter gentilis]XP_049649809.1 uncharacterized protein LOC126035336 [Accipiter gentilis]